MTELFRTNLKYLHKMNGKILDHDLNKKCKNNYINSLKVFYINPLHSKERRKEILNQFKLSTIPSEQIERIDPVPFPFNASHKLKNDIITKEHIRMWQKAFEQNCDGALFFEDDVYFLKNWKYILEQIFNETELPHVIRFDAAPLSLLTDLPCNKVALLSSHCFACMGGYYLSKDAIQKSLQYVEQNEWKWDTCEYLLLEITKTYFKNSSYETIPRICIQNWFLHESSSIQSNKHMMKCKEVMYNGYLQKYYTRYMFSKEIIDKIEKTFNNYIIDNSIIKILE